MLTGSSHFIYYPRPKTETKPAQQPPANEAQKDMQKEADKYVNRDIPAHNKLFIATLISLGVLIVMSRER